MADYDVFNGDADGLCSLIQLRLEDPRDSVLVTGVKRDIQLLQQVAAGEGDRIAVLDVSLDKNREALQSNLDAGAEVFYCDHHFAGEIPQAHKLTALINTASDVCTSLLVNGHLGAAHAAWAVVGAFGDNLRNSALAAARPLGLDEPTLQQLENLGIYINYNGYGAALQDLYFEPAELFKLMLPYADPLLFMADGAEHFQRLETGYREDMAAAAALMPEHEAPGVAVYVLPEAPWARRVSGVYSNDLANGHPQRAHAVLTEKSGGNYLVSVRAPLANKTGADELCRQFATGGGRAAAAGINDLPAQDLPRFIDTFSRQFAAA